MVRCTKELQQRSQLGQLPVQRAQQRGDPVEGEGSHVPVRGMMARRERDDESSKEDSGRVPKRGVKRADGDRSPQQMSARRRDDEGTICKAGASSAALELAGEAGLIRTWRPERVKFGGQELLEKFDKRVREADGGAGRVDHLDDSRLRKRRRREAQ